MNVRNSGVVVVVHFVRKRWRQKKTRDYYALPTLKVGLAIEKKELSRKGDFDCRRCRECVPLGCEMTHG